MTAEEHIVAWIESSGPHYKQLCDIARRRADNAPDGYISQHGVACAAHNLVYMAYREMVNGGDALRDDPYSAAELLRAAAAICEWELPA